ncbi:MAG: hypothetical protein K8I29_16900 [Alphaproteobacteria bacterium]|uniref:Uncharacterized protein n=1 Tax=Candidatus Nitrobium versatile TaxID=2884831 RepID=A0A953M2R6_9BACT|nr:hypothetical protein [Candidatus Nitrobium versatile]
MSKRPSNTSGHRSVAHASLERGGIPLPLILFLPLLLLFLASCAPKHIDTSLEGVRLEQVLDELQRVSSIEAVLSLEYEKKDSTMSGDALLQLAQDTLTMRIYYLGFLAGEITEEEGIIRSKPKLDRNKSILLVEGLRNSFFWWNMKEYRLQEGEDVYILSNSYRKVFISKKTLLPVRQTIELESGDTIEIAYDEPAWNAEAAGGSAAPLLQRYQSKLTIGLRNHLVRARVTSYTAQEKNDPKAPR